MKEKSMMEKKVQNLREKMATECKPRMVGPSKRPHVGLKWLPNADHVYQTGSCKIEGNKMVVNR